MADWTTIKLNLRSHWKTVLLWGRGLLVTSIALSTFSYPVSAQEPYPWDTGICEAGECPTRYVIEGFDVRISPAVYEAPDFTHAALGRELDTLKAQLLWMTSHNAVPQTAIQHLIDSEVSFYLDTAPDWSDWWPCSQEARAAPCYHAALNRIGLPVLGTEWPYPNKHGQPWLLFDHTQASVVLHELTHAFHAHVVIGGDDNICIKNTYEQSKHRYRAVEEREQVSQNHRDGRPMHERTPPGPLPPTPHYAMTNAVEYFAEGSEAMWAFNGEYPWNRSEMWKHDRAGYMLIWNAWHDPKGFCPEQQRRDHSGNPVEKR